MKQSDLNNVRMDDWDYEGQYEECFRLKLTAKHALVIGKWENNDDWGVDLRRWSYDKSRLLGEGISLNANTWGSLYKKIDDLYKKKAFKNYGEVSEEIYVSEITVDAQYTLKTEIFDNNIMLYLCINLLENGKAIWRGRYSRIGIMIRFDTIPDFLIKCQSNKLV